MKPKDERTIQERAQDLEKVLSWCIINNIKKYYKTLQNFKKTYTAIVDGKASKQDQVDFCYRFGFKQMLWRKILGCVDGKYVCLKDVEPFYSTWFHYHHKCNKKHSQWQIHSYWYLDFAVVGKYLNDPNVADCRSSFYTKKQYDLINEIFLKNKGKKEEMKINGLTKEQWEQKFANGELAFPWDKALKFQEKEKRSADRHKARIVKKAVKESLTDYAKLELENQQLKAEIERLKNLKDLNSDIPTETAEIFDNPDDIDWENDVPEDERERDAWINKHCSEACKKQLKAEFEASLKKEEEEEDFDYGAEAAKVHQLLEDMKAEEKKVDDIDESDALVLPKTNSQKVIQYALRKRGAKEEQISFVLSSNLIPIDDSFRFFYCQYDGKKTVVDPAADKIYTIDGRDNFKVGSAIYYFDKSKCKDFYDKQKDKFFYANRYLTYVWKNSKNEYFDVQKKLGEYLGYKPTKDFN